MGSARSYCFVSRFFFPDNAVLYGKRPRHGRDNCLRDRMGRLRPGIPYPVKQDDIKGTSGIPKGLFPGSGDAGTAMTDRKEDHAVSRTAG